MDDTNIVHCLRQELRRRNDPVLGPRCRDMANIDIAHLRAERLRHATLKRENV